MFKFPTRHGFNPRSILKPGFKLYFYDADLNTLATAFADVGETLAHTSPITIDRNNNFPSIFLSALIDYKIVVEDEKGQEVYRIKRMPWPDPLTLPTISYTDGLVTNVTWNDGTSAAYTYVGGLAATVTVSDGDNSRVLTANYTGSLVTSIT